MMEIKNNKRSRRVNLLHFVVLPAIIIGHEIILDVFFHYSGRVGMANVFSLENFINYFTTNMAEIGIIIAIAIVIVVIVELILEQVEKAK